MSYLDDPFKKQGQVADGGGDTSTVASFSNGIPATQQGSGRFTDLKKYINANPNAGANIANKASNSVNSGFNSFQNGYNAQNQKTNDAFNQGRTLLDGSGQGYNSQLDQFNAGVNGFKGFSKDNTADQATFDQTGQDIQKFAAAPEFGQFQNIKAGTAVDTKGLNTQQQDLSASNAGMLKNVNDYGTGLNTEAGRQNLLQKTVPRFGNYDLGNARLDQLFFQTNPSAITGLQNAFNNQKTILNGNSQSLNALGQNIEKLGSDQTRLATDLTSKTDNLQNGFNSVLNTQANKDFISGLRNDKYNAYVNELKGLGTGQSISADVAAMLGLSGAGQYNPTVNAASTGGKLMQLPTKDMADNQFRMYNVPIGSENVAESFLQRGQGLDPGTLSYNDILGGQNWDTYSALAKLSGKDTGQATGPSQLGAAVSARTGTGSLANLIANKDADFANNYGGKIIQSSGWTNQGGPGGDQNIGSNANAISAANLLNPNQVLTPTQVWNNAWANSQYGSGAVADVTADIDRAVANDSYTPYQQPFSQNGKTWDNNGDATATREAIAIAQGTAMGNTTNMLNNILNSTGVKNVGTIDNTNVTDDPIYSRFAGLV